MLSRLALVFASCIVLCSGTSPHVKGTYYHAPPEPVCPPFVPDFTSTETSLRTAIFQGDACKAADILDSKELFNLGRGLTYSDEQTCLLVRNPGPNAFNDPDVVAFRALALNAECYGDIDKLAAAVVLASDAVCACDQLDTWEKDDVLEGVKEVLSDPKERDFIINYDGTEDEEEPDHAPDHTGVGEIGRRLFQTESNPTNSLPCAYCRPRRACRRARFRWCQS